MLKIRKAVSASLQADCREHLAKEPVSNVLLLGDLYAPLLRVSTIHVATEDSRIVGVCSIYRAFSTPSIVFQAATLEIKQALVEKALGEVPSEFISLCQPEEIDLFKKRSVILQHRPEQHMVASPPKSVGFNGFEVARVKENELELLNRFYVEHRSEAWTPIQFEAGPYYCVKQEGKIVSAAGVHVVAPQIAQLGNIVTDEAFRNRGFATACTSVLSADLASDGRIVGLFVRVENAPAIHMYEQLGFVKKRDVAFLFMRKKP